MALVRKMALFRKNGLKRSKPRFSHSALVGARRARTGTDDRIPQEKNASRAR
jgi:hypothetical protein